MKFIKTASGKQSLKMSRKEWENIGKKAGWIKKADMELELQKNISIWSFLDDWGNEGYGIALISPDDKIVDPYIDASDYPDIVLNKSGNGAKVIGGKYKGYYIIFHSGQFENNIGKDWRDIVLSNGNY